MIRLKPDFAAPVTGLKPESVLHANPRGMRAACVGVYIVFNNALLRNTHSLSVG